MRFVLKQTRLGLRNSTVRIPFRYGSACLTRCPQAVLEATIETGGHVQRGYSGDCLPPSWFDKTPGKSFARQIDDMLAVIGLAEKTLVEEAAAPVELFPAWLAAYERVHERAREWQLCELLASFGLSMVERAVMDGLARAANASFAEAVRANLYGIDPGEVHASLAGLKPADWLPAAPPRSIFVRHTVGLGDPLTAGDIAGGDRVDDGLPQALEEYIQRTGTRYFKVKVSGDLDRDVDRLRRIAALAEKHLGTDYHLTLDGNEQYKQADQFDALVEAIRSTAELETLAGNILAIEQPLDRHIALDEAHTAGIRELGRWKPVIIDESDAALGSYPEAMRLGYRGVSSKNCKGPIKSLFNAGLTWLANNRHASGEFLLTGEDLCTVGIVPVQSDLALVATLGLAHVERNGHHYHRGLGYLPAAEQRAALAAHPDFYGQQHDVIGPRLSGGRFEIASLQCTGFGFAVEPEMDAMQRVDQWRFESLGLEE